MNNIIFLLHTLLLYTVTYIARYFGRQTLVLWLCFLPVCANLVVTKQIMLFGFEVTSADVYTIAFFFGMNIIHEQYGKSQAYRTLVLTMIVTLAIPFLLSMHLLYEPSIHDKLHTSFDLVFGITPKIASLSFVSFCLSQIFERVLFGYISKHYTWSFVLRSFVAVTCSSLIDTWFFTFTALSSIVFDLWSVFFVSYAIKQICLLVWSLTYLLQTRLRVQHGH